MAVYPLYYNNGTQYLPVNGKGYDTNTLQVVNITDPPIPSPINLRTFNLPLGQVTGKKGFGFRYGDMMVRGDGYITFFGSYASMSGPAPRLYVYDEPRQKTWKNVDITVEYMRVSENNPPSYAGLGIGARSIHELGGTNGPTYYLKHTFDGRFFFEKEQVHGQSYTKQPGDTQNKSYPMLKNVWYKIGFQIRGNTLYGYQWVNNAWKLIRQYTDTGTWNSNAPITQGTSCFIRNDGVTDFRIKQFSIKEVS